MPDLTPQAAQQAATLQLEHDLWELPCSHTTQGGMTAWVCRGCRRKRIEAALTTAFSAGEVAGLEAAQCPMKHFDECLDPYCQIPRHQFYTIKFHGHGESTERQGGKK